MDAVVKPLDMFPLKAERRIVERPSREEAEAAVRTLIRWTGEDPQREGLLDTPKRVVSSYETLFGGYREDPFEELKRTFEEVQGYDDLVLVRDIPFYSHCEHHLVPFVARPMSAIIRAPASWACRSSLASSISTQGGCRRRRR